MEGGFTPRPFMQELQTFQKRTSSKQLPRESLTSNSVRHRMSSNLSANVNSNQPNPFTRSDNILPGNRRDIDKNYEDEIEQYELYNASSKSLSLGQVMRFPTRPMQKLRPQQLQKLGEVQILHPPRDPYRRREGADSWRARPSLGREVHDFLESYQPTIDQLFEIQEPERRQSQDTQHKSSISGPGRSRDSSIQIPQRSRNPTQVWPSQKAGGAQGA